MQESEEQLRQLNTMKLQDMRPLFVQQIRNNSVGSRELESPLLGGWYAHDSSDQDGSINSDTGTVGSLQRSVVGSTIKTEKGVSYSGVIDKEGDKPIDIMADAGSSTSQSGSKIDDCYQEGEKMVVIKRGSSKKDRIVTVVDPDWNGMVKVDMDGDVKTYDAADLQPYGKTDTAHSKSQLLPELSAATWLYGRAMSNLYGTQVLWLGLWTQMDVGVSLDLGWEPSLQRDAGYALSGLAVLIAGDQFYSDAGVTGSFWIHSQNQKFFGVVPPISSNTLCGKLITALHTIVTVFFSILLWIGACLLLQNHTFPTSWTDSPWLYVTSCALSPFLMYSSGTLFVDTDGEEIECGVELPSWDSSLRVHAYAILRACCSFAAQIGLYFGAWQLLAGYNYTNNSANCWKTICEVLVGLFLWAATGSFVDNDNVLMSAEDPQRNRTPQDDKIVLIFRSVMSMYAGIVHNIGVWQLLDMQIVDGWSDCSLTGISTIPFGCSSRNYLFIGVGALLCVDLLVVPLFFSSQDSDDDNDNSEACGKICVGDEMIVTKKDSGKKGLRVTVLDPEWNGMVKVTLDGLTKSYKESDLQLSRRRYAIQNAMDTRARLRAPRLGPLGQPVLPSRRRQQAALVQKRDFERGLPERRNAVPRRITSARYRSTSVQGSTPEASRGRERREELAKRHRAQVLWKRAAQGTADLHARPEPQRAQQCIIPSHAPTPTSTLPIEIPISHAASAAMSLPTPRTLAMLGEDQFLRSVLGPSRLRTTFAIGDLVEVNWSSCGYWYTGTVISIQEDGTYTVRYDDDDVERGIPGIILRPQNLRRPRLKRLDNTGHGAALGQRSAECPEWYKRETLLVNDEEFTPCVTSTRSRPRRSTAVAFGSTSSTADTTQFRSRHYSLPRTMVTKSKPTGLDSRSESGTVHLPKDKPRVHFESKQSPPTSTATPLSMKTSQAASQTPIVRPSQHRRARSYTLGGRQHLAPADS